MKKMKKFASVLLALVMALALAMPALAANVDDENNSNNSKMTTITAPSGDRTYEVYQIFTGDLADGVLSNVKWGQNGTGTGGEAVDKDILKALEDLANSTDTDKLAEIEKYVSFEGTSMGTITNESKLTVPTGYYLIKDLGVYNEETGKYEVPDTESISLYVVEVVGPVDITPKTGTTSVDKVIVEDEEEKDENEASIGDTINYKITGTLPEDLENYQTYYYVFTDTLSKGLTYKGDVKVEIVTGEIVTDVTDYFYRGVTNGYNTENHGDVTITVGIQDLLALNATKDADGSDVEPIANVTPDSKIVITYSAILNENAVIGNEGNPNDVKLTYSNNPNDSGTPSTKPPENPDEPEPEHPVGETPKHEVITYTTELTITKRANSDEGAFLPGTEFTLTGNGVNIVLVTSETFEEAADGEYWKLKDGTYTTTEPTVADDETDNTADYDSTETKYTKVTSVTAKGEGKSETDVVGTIGADGTVTFQGLGAGSYTLTETKTLPGYNTIEPINFTIVFNGTTFEADAENSDVFTVTNVSEGAVITSSSWALATTIINNSGSTLPETGGIGTTIFYVVGGVLVVGAAVLLITKKRMGSD